MLFGWSVSWLDPIHPGPTLGRSWGNPIWMLYFACQPSSFANRYRRWRIRRLYHCSRVVPTSPCVQGAGGGEVQAPDVPDVTAVPRHGSRVVPTTPCVQGQVGRATEEEGARGLGAPPPIKWLMYEG